MAATESQKRYFDSDKGMAVVAKYRSSDKRKETLKAYRERNRERLRANNARYRAAHPDAVSVSNKSQRALLKKNEPERLMFYAAKRRAKKLGVPFDISVVDIIIPDTCPILGLTLMLNDGGSRANSPSLDRIVPSLGYVKGNVQVISHKANTMKNDASADELRMFAEWVKRTMP